MMLLKIFVASLAFSYIPHSHFILKKSAETHGKGTYRVLQEVIFQTANDRAVIQETWMVNSGTQMYLEAKGPQTAYTAVYDNNSKFTIQANSRITTNKIPTDFFESFFHFRSANEYTRAIINAGITGNEILTPQRRYNQLKDVEYKGQNFVRLARTNGTIAYAFGATVTGESSNIPTLWIEQDTFRVRRLRFKSSNEIMADEYEQFSNGLEFPKTRSLNLPDLKVTIRTLSINSVKADKSFKDLLQTKAKLEPNGNGFPNSELGTKIQKFYQVFR